MPDLSISEEKVTFLIEKAREFDAKEGDVDPDSGSNPSDDDDIDVLEEGHGDPVEAELSSFIRAMNEDEQLDLVALMWLGRGDGSIEEWDDLRSRAVEAAPPTRFASDCHLVANAVDAPLRKESNTSIARPLVSRTTRLLR